MRFSIKTTNRLRPSDDIHYAILTLHDRNGIHPKILFDHENFRTKRILSGGQSDTATFLKESHYARIKNTPNI